MGVTTTPHPLRRQSSRTSTDSQVSQPFLTEAQRAALDAALAAKQLADEPNGVKVSHGKAAHHDHVHTKREILHDRHIPRNAKGGKGGGGAIGSKRDGVVCSGKYSWGNPLKDNDDVDALPALDHNDPNYDSDDDKPVYLENSKSLMIKEYKQAVIALLGEYFNSGDLNEAARSIQELDEPDFDHFFVKKAITLAMDKHDREREMTSVLLSTLYSEVISSACMQRGFLSVVDALDDLRLDVPDAIDIVALFIARAVVDDILPPAWVGKLPADSSTSAGQVRNKCELHLGARHAAERLLRCWGAGAGLIFEETRDSIRKMMAEFVDSHDAAEVQRCLRALAVPFFHHEFVKQALHRAMDEPSHQPHILGLISQLHTTGELSEAQIMKGCQRVADNIQDTVLDNPAAHERFADIVHQAQQSGWLPSSFVVPQDPVVSTNGNGLHSHGVQSFKQAAVAAVREYFASDDADEVARQLLALEEPGLHHIFVKHAVQLSMDRKDREREMISNLLVALTPKVIARDQIESGFTRLLATCEDITLDIPSAPDTLSLFLGRALVDELLPPSFLTSCLPALKSESMGVSIVKATGALLVARHAAERLQGCWHGGANTLQQCKEAMNQLVQEYLVSGDAREAARCLMDLCVPHYHHQMVLAALYQGVATQKNTPAIATLLRQLDSSGEITQTQMRKGFERMAKELDDIVLDCPHARELFTQIKDQAIKEGWLAEE